MEREPRGAVGASFLSNPEATLLSVSGAGTTGPGPARHEAISLICGPVVTDGRPALLGEQPQEPRPCFLLRLPDLGAAGAGPAGPLAPTPARPADLLSHTAPIVAVLGGSGRAGQRHTARWAPGGGSSSIKGQAGGAALASLWTRVLRGHRLVLAPLT